MRDNWADMHEQLPTSKPAPVNIGFGPTSRSLDDVHSSVPVRYPGLWRRLFAFAGPAYLVSVGYMDPGNWATDLEGGARFHYELLWVLLMSNAMAVLLQTLSARLGIVSGRDLARACRDSYAPGINLALWILCEIAIAACDLAEVIGTIIGLKLLFGLPELYGLIVTAADTFLLLAIQRLGIRKMEAFILALVSTIGICFLIEIILAQPDWGEAVRGLIPHLHGSAPYVFSQPEALYVAIGILGATVMPHNLYLHSALVQTRQIPPTPEGLRQACRYNLFDSALALNAAFFVNASILILAAATFHGNADVEALGGAVPLERAPELLQFLLGTDVARIAFSLALLCSGQSSTLTGTLAGQVVMEGFLELRLRPWVRRLLTRIIAIGPALLALLYWGETSMTDLLVLSQVILSLQLPFAVVPLLQFTSNKRRMGEFVNQRWVMVLGWICVAIIVTLNGHLVLDKVGDWVQEAGPNGIWVGATLYSLVGACSLLLAWLVIGPWLVALGASAPVELTAEATARDVAAGLIEPHYRRIGVGLDHSRHDAATLRHAISLARSHGAELVLIHVVEGVGGQVHGVQAADLERRSDQSYLEELSLMLRDKGIPVRAVLQFGNPTQELGSVAQREQLDLLVLGSHGHGWLGDWLLGETTGPVRHRVHIPVLVVREP
jgi:manganese transport protein